MYGAFVDDRQVGFVGMHSEGSLGLLYVEEAYRRQGIAVSLEAYVINRALEKGWIPYGHVIVGNEKSFALQEKLGLYRSDRTVWWLERK
ncbi:MAG: GNAT family N-acetyltransferase [Blautia sp.]|nr:GNAT family N-acetyltransferase [Blautia sp.]